MPLSPLNQNNPGPKKPFNWGRFSKTLSFWVLIILIPVAFIQLQSGRGDSAPTISYSEYDAQLNRETVSRVTIKSGQVVVGELKAPIKVGSKDARKSTTRLPMENSAADLERLRQHNVQIEATEQRPPLGSYV